MRFEIKSTNHVMLPPQRKVKVTDPVVTGVDPVSKTEPFMLKGWAEAQE